MTRHFILLITAAGGDARVYFGYNQFNLTPSAMDNLRAGWARNRNGHTNVLNGAVG